MSATLEDKGIGTEAVYAPEKQNWDLGQAQLEADYLAVAQQDPFALVYSKVVRNDVKKKFNATRSERYLLDLGDYHLLNKSYPRAERAYREASRNEKYVLQATRKLINLSILQGDVDKATQYFDKLIYHSDNNVNYLIEKASFLLSNYSPELSDKIARSLESAVAIEPNNAETLNLAGIYHLVKNELDEAVSDFRKVLTVDASNVHATNNIGVIYSLKNSLNNAKKQYLKAIDLDAQYSTGYENLASLFVRENKLNDALSVLNQAVESNVALSEAWDHNYGYLLLQTNNLNEAVTWYKNKIEQEPENNLLYNNLGKCYEVLNNSKQARSYYEKAADIAKSNIEKGVLFDGRIWTSFYNLMNAYQGAGDFNKLENLVTYIEQFLPRDWRTLYYKAIVKIDKYEYDTAKSLLKELLTINPECIDAKINLGFIFDVIDKNYKATIATLEPVVKAYGHHIIVDNNLIYAYLKSSNINKAKNLLDLHKNEHTLPHLVASRGLYYFRKDMPEKADVEYKKAITLFKGKSKKLATQVWLNEKAEYYLSKGQTKDALQAINKSLETFKEGYSYADALAIKERALSS